MTDPSNPPLLQLVADMTGLRNISAEEKAQFKTRADTDAFEASTGRIGEYADLWGIANAAFSFIHKNKKVVLIRPSDLVSFLLPNIEGDKRRKSFKPACDRQIQRMRDALKQAPFDIALDGRTARLAEQTGRLVPNERMADRLQQLREMTGSMMAEGLEHHAQRMIDGGEPVFNEIGSEFQKALQAQDSDDIEFFQKLFALYAGKVADEKLKARALFYASHRP
jgi:hypothetical protein